MQELLADDAFVKRCARHRAINQKLRQSGLELEQAIQFLFYDRFALIIKAHNHRGEHSNAVPAKLGKDLLDGSALLFCVAGARALVADPEPVDPHFQDLFDGILADGFDAGKNKDGKGSSAPYHAVSKLHGPLLVEQEILVEDREDHLGIQLEVALHHGEDVFAGGQELDVLAREKVRGAAKIATVGTAQPGKDHPGAGHLLPKHLEAAYDQGM